MADLAKVENECIVIRIYPDALAHATLHGVLSTFNPRINGFITVEITNFVEWRQAVVDILNKEQESGNTLISTMLDEALEQARDFGADGLRFNDE